MKKSSAICGTGQPLTKWEQKAILEFLKSLPSKYRFSDSYAGKCIIVEYVEYDEGFFGTEYISLKDKAGKLEVACINRWYNQFTVMRRMNKTKDDLWDIIRKEFPNWVEKYGKESTT